MRKIKYDTEKYPFREAFSKALETTELEDLHELKYYEKFNVYNDQDTVFHAKFYENYEKEVKPLYEKFVDEVIKPYFDFEPLVYQKVPTFRAHLVGNVAVGEWHKDRDYNHGVNEINCWLPVTRAYGTNTIWLESEEDKGDFEAYDVEYGEVLVFDGANLFHGNKDNIEEDTRVSFDFRVVNGQEFEDRDVATVSAGKGFKIGEYFELV